MISISRMHVSIDFGFCIDFFYIWIRRFLTNEIVGIIGRFWLSPICLGNHLTLSSVLVSKYSEHLILLHLKEPRKFNYSTFVQRDFPKRKNVFKPCDLNISRTKTWRIPLERYTLPYFSRNFQITRLENIFTFWKITLHNRGIVNSTML